MFAEVPKKLKRAISEFRLFKFSVFSSKSGSSLIEVMMAMMILVVLVLGVASFIYYGRSGVYAQRDRLSVLEFVNGRMEALLAAQYSSVEPPDKDYRVYYTVWRSAGGVFAAPQLGRWRQRFDVNSGRTGSRRRYQSTITVQYVDVDGGAASYDALKLTVSVRYRRRGGDAFQNIMSLSTYRVP